MKKILLGALLPLLMLSSCSNNEELDPQGGEGTLVITSKILTDDVQVIPTRAVTPDLFVTITNTANNNIFVENMKLPENETIGNIPVGNYTVTLTTHPDGYIPAFGTPYYEGGQQNVQVTQNSNQSVNIICTQKNAGVRFIYDSSLQTAGLGNMYPVINQNNVVLEYKDGNKQQTGYFNAGDIAITLTDANGTPYRIGGASERRLTLGSQQLWEVTLKANNSTGNNPGSDVEVGSIIMIVNIIAIDTPTNKDEFLVDKSEKLFDISMIQTTEGNMFKIKAETLMDEIAFYYLEESLWDGQQMTKDRIQTSGRRLSSVELTEVSSPTGKTFDILSSMKEHTVYRVWVYGSQNGVEQIHYLDVSYFN